MGYSLSPVWTELSSSHSYNSAGKETLTCSDTDCVILLVDVLETLCECVS